MLLAKFLLFIPVFKQAQAPSYTLRIPQPLTPPPSTCRKLEQLEVALHHFRQMAGLLCIVDLPAHDGFAFWRHAYLLVAEEMEAALVDGHRLHKARAVEELQGLG